MAVDAVPTTTMSPLDCTASALGLLMPSVKNAALVTPISVPLDVYRTRAKSSSFGTPLPSPVTTAMLPLDCSMAVSGLTLTPPKVVVTVPPVPKVGSRLPGAWPPIVWACAELTLNKRPIANSPVIVINVPFFMVSPFLSDLVHSRRSRVRHRYALRVGREADFGLRAFADSSLFIALLGCTANVCQR